MSHQHLPSTHLDHLTAVFLIMFFAFILVMIAGPARILARERDVTRTDDVRTLMTAAIEMEEVYPGAYQVMMSKLEASNGLKMMLGKGDCQGSFGSMCSDLAIDDNCLDPESFFTPDILPITPVDPRRSIYSENLTGYYFSLNQGRLEVGACEPALGPIVLSR